MEPIETIDGYTVTEGLLDQWSEALDRDEWPAGEDNLGPIIEGGPRSLSPAKSAVLTVKIPEAMKTAIEQHAKNEGITLSEYVRASLAHALMDVA